MRPILRSLTFLLCLQFAAMAAFGQADVKPFTGVWELAQASYDGNDMQQSGPGTYKIFRTDGTFANVQVYKQGSAITHSGEFAVDNAGAYTETALYWMPQLKGGELGKSIKINYEFSADKKWITLSFTPESGTICKELWRRL